MLFIIEVRQRDHPNMVRDTFAGSDNTKRCMQPVRGNHVKGFATQLPPRPLISFLDHRVPRNNQMYIFHLPNASRLEHQCERQNID